MSDDSAPVTISERRESNLPMPEPTLAAVQRLVGETGRVNFPDVCGRVVHGDQRGRTLGFPTANLELDERSAGIPCDEVLADGVWAGRCVLRDGRSIPAAISIGRRRTFYGGDGPRLLEAHLIDFAEDLYGEEIRVHLDLWIRAQTAFATKEDLVDALESDVRYARVHVK